MELKLSQMKVLHSENRNFRPFWLLWPWPWPDDFHIRTWPVFPELLTSRLSQVIVWKTNRQTDTAEILYHAASRVVKDNCEQEITELNGDRTVLVRASLEARTTNGKAMQYEASALHASCQWKTPDVAGRTIELAWQHWSGWHR